MPRGKLTQVNVVARFTPLLVGLALMMFVLSGCGMASRASQDEVAKGRSTSSIRLELSPTNNSGVSGSATFTKAATGTRVELELRGLPEPYEIYLATLAPTASTLGAATTPCALAAARTKATVGVATTISVRWMGARTPSTVALALIASKLIPGTTPQGGVRKSQGLAKRSARED